MRGPEREGETGGSWAKGMNLVDRIAVWRKGFSHRASAGRSGSERKEPGDWMNSRPNPTYIRIQLHVVDRKERTGKIRDPTIIYGHEKSETQSPAETRSVYSKNKGADERPIDGTRYTSYDDPSNPFLCAYLRHP